MKPISVNELKKLMHEGIVEFAYTKKDGSVRNAKGTLQEEHITTTFAQNADGRTKQLGWCNYWDVEKEGWRKFNENKLIGIID